MMKWVYMGFVFLLLYFLFFTNGTFPEDPALADVRLFLLGVGLLAILSASVFFHDVWNKNMQKGFQPQEVKAKTLKTPYQVMRITNMMMVIFIVVFIAAIALAMEYMGYHDVLVAIIEWLQAKGEKLINAMTH